MLLVITLILTELIAVTIGYFKFEYKEDMENKKKKK